MCNSTIAGGSTLLTRLRIRMWVRCPCAACWDPPNCNLLGAWLQGLSSRLEQLLPFAGVVIKVRAHKQCTPLEHAAVAGQCWLHGIRHAASQRLGGHIGSCSSSNHVHSGAPPHSDATSPAVSAAFCWHGMA